MNLVYRNEERLFRLMLVWSLLIWGVLLLITFGLALVYLLFGFLFYCVAQSALISYIKGNGVRITEEQFPDLKQQISACCRKLGLDEEPQAYLMQMGGMLNAFATRFLGRHFLVLYSDVVDGLADNPDALNFYIGHEIGHIKRKHLHWATILMPASALPLIGPAYSRARMMNHRAYVDQASQTEGFWMSFHELVGDYPWLVKRMAAVRALAAGHELRQPPRSKLAALLALFVPCTGIGDVDVDVGAVSPGGRASTPSGH